MKKILLLGGSAQQIIAIEAAKRLGYYTVLCDYLTDNPGRYLADKHCKRGKGRWCSSLCFGTCCAYICICVRKFRFTWESI